jgi:hypothetical protein
LVTSGQASTYENILLFKTNLTDADPPNGLTLDELSTESKDLQNDLEIADTELFYQNKFLTRFSSTILSAVMFPDQQHIVFQLGKQIRVMDLDGSNNKLLFELDSVTPTPLAFRGNGSILIYYDTTSSSIKAKTIR